MVFSPQRFISLAVVNVPELIFGGEGLDIEQLHAGEFPYLCFKLKIGLCSAVKLVEPEFWAYA